MKSLKHFLFLIVIHIIIMDCAKVSPKLDFEEQSELVQVKKEIKGGKIKGLRVTVDTSELKESKSSGSESSSSESFEKKKTVGVRTDVTFEITSGETNDTKTMDEKEIGKDDDNASIPIVPVFKGKPDRGSNGKEPNVNDIWSVIPLDPSPTRGPIYRKFDEEGNRYGGAGDSWKQYPQYAIWTTERNNRRHDQPIYHNRGQYEQPSNFVPYQINHPHLQPGHVCNCKEYPGPYINPSQTSSGEINRNQQVDDKLDKPFSRT